MKKFKLDKTEIQAMTIELTALFQTLLENLASDDEYKIMMAYNMGYALTQGYDFFGNLIKQGLKTGIQLSKMEPDCKFETYEIVKQWKNDTLHNVYEFDNEKNKDSTELENQPAYKLFVKIFNKENNDQ